MFYPVFKFNTPKHGEVEATGRTESFKAREIGDKITIYYDPKNPRKVDYHRKRVEKFVIFLMILITLVIPFYMAFTGMLD